MTKRFYEAFDTPDELATRLVALGEPIDLYTTGWVTWEGAKDIFERLAVVYPGKRMYLVSIAAGLDCGFVPA